LSVEENEPIARFNIKIILFLKQNALLPLKCIK
jgi:hypothetical protein